MPDSYLLTHKQAALLAVIAGGRNYGREIRNSYTERMNKRISTGGLYESLALLEEKGYLASEIGEETHERGGNRRRYFTITAPGEWALQRFRGTVRPQSLSPVNGFTFGGRAE